MRYSYTWTSMDKMKRLTMRSFGKNMKQFAVSRTAEWEYVNCITTLETV